jgi:hypothetical protein
MIGASVGAFLLLGLSAFTSWPVSGGGVGGGAGRDAVNPAYESKAGDCLSWRKPDLSDVRKVDCGSSHLFEVTGTVDISAQYAKDAPFPADDLWQKISKEHCAKPSLDYLGGKFDPYGKYTVGPLNPGAQQWAGGYRTLRCGLQVVGPAGGLLPASGSAKSQDQSDVYDPGVCLGINGNSIGDPIPCVEPHTFEIVGVVDLGASLPGDFPPPEKQDEVLPAKCDAMAAEYSGGADLKAKNLVVTWDNRVLESWSAGSKKVNCKIGAAVGAGAAGLTAWTGSVRNPNAPPLTTSNPPQTTAVSQAEATGAPLHSGSNAPSQSSGQQPPSGSSPPSTTQTSSSR